MISFDSDCLLQVCLSYICFSPLLYYVDVLEPLLRTFIAFIMNGNCYNEPQIAVGHFKKYFKYTLYIIISMNIVMYSSKDWSFNQIMAYL